MSARTNILSALEEAPPISRRSIWKRPRPSRQEFVRPSLSGAILCPSTICGFQSDSFLCERLLKLGLVNYWTRGRTIPRFPGEISRNGRKSIEKVRNISKITGFPGLEQRRGVSLRARSLNCRLRKNQHISSDYGSLIIVIVSMCERCVCVCMRERVYAYAYPPSLSERFWNGFFRPAFSIPGCLRENYVFANRRCVLGRVLSKSAISDSLSKI